MASKSGASGMWYAARMRAAGASADCTERSLLWENLEIAAHDPFCTVTIVYKVIDKVLGSQETDNGLCCYDVACALAIGNIDGVTTQAIANRVPTVV